MIRNFAGNVGTGGTPIVGGSSEFLIPESNPPPDPLLTDKEVAEMMSCGRSTVWRYAATGIIPQPLKIGGMSRWRQSTIEQLIRDAEAKASIT